MKRIGWGWLALGISLGTACSGLLPGGNPSEGLVRLPHGHYALAGDPQLGPWRLMSHPSPTPGASASPRPSATPRAWPSATPRPRPSADEAGDLCGRVLYDGLPQAGAVVSVVDGDQVAVTDAEGRFYLAGVDGQDQLVASARVASASDPDELVAQVLERLAAHDPCLVLTINLGHVDQVTIDNRIITYNTVVYDNSHHENSTVNTDNSIHDSYNESSAYIDNSVRTTNYTVDSFKDESQRTDNSIHDAYNDNSTNSFEGRY